MNYADLYNDVCHDFGHDVALNVIIAVSIHLSTEPLDTEWESSEGRYSKRVTNKIRQQVDPAHINLVLDIWAVVHTWQIQRELDGLGGAKAQSIYQLLKRECAMNNEDRGDWEHDVAKDKELDRRWEEEKE